MRLQRGAPNLPIFRPSCEKNLGPETAVFRPAKDVQANGWTWVPYGSFCTRAAGGQPRELDAGAAGLDAFEGGDEGVEVFAGVVGGE
jgi:hypothetical protein